MIVVPFQAAHIQQLKLQEAQAVMQSTLVEEGYAEWLENGGPAFSAVVDGEIIAALGIIPQWDNRAIAWGLIGSGARDQFIPLTKAIMRFLKLTPYRRIETSVQTNFAEGHRWARMLGFSREGTMKAYTPDGSDHDLYARVK